LLVIAVVALALLLAVESVVLAATTRNGGAVTAVRTVTGTDIVATSSQTYVAVPGMSVSVNVPSGEEALLVITFSAVTECFVNAGIATFCQVRVRVDGSSPPPGALTFDSAADGVFGMEATSMQWVSGPLSAGPHTVRVDYRVDEANSLFYMTQRTLTVLRSKVTI
jgi:hypothetical protein